VEALIEATDPAFRLPVLLMYGCGLRLAECIGPRLHNFNLDERLLAGYELPTIQGLSERRGGNADHEMHEMHERFALLARWTSSELSCVSCLWWFSPPIRPELEPRAWPLTHSGAGQSA
jgi:hypothetical protein